MMEHGKLLNVAIVGGGPGCKAIMDMMFAEKLRQLQMKLVGVACTNPQAVGYRYAQEKGIYTTRDYRDLYKLKDLNMIIELTGREEVANEISRTKPDHIRLMDHVAARVFWDVFQIEEEKLAERKRSEKATKLAYAELNQIFETAADGMCVIDKDFNVLRVNESFSALSGVSKAQAIGKKCHEVFRGPLCHTPKCTLTRILGGEERVECETEKERKDGIRIPCILSATPFRGSDGKLIGIVEDFKDITDRKQAEEELAAERERLHVTLRSIGDGVIATDPEGRIVLLNNVAEKLTGWTEKEAIGKPLGEVFHIINEITRERCVNPVDKVIKTGAIVGLANHTVLISKDGTERILADSAAPIRDANDHVIGVVLVFQDITEKRKLEAQLHQSQKLEAIGTLAGGIAHDFNNLLMGMQGHTSLMLLDIDYTHPHFEHLKGIEDMVKRGADLTTQLLGFARGGKYEVTPTDLNGLIEKSAEMFGRTKKEIRIHRKFQKDTWTVEVDRTQIEQVLLNLYVNAWQAMPRGGDLYIETSNVVLDEKYTKSFGVRPGNYVKISMTDTGLGMDQATQQRIFDPFFTTKEMGRGTGLGLASVYGIIQNHDGIINVYSEKDKGTTFNIYLPASEKEVAIIEKEPTDEILKGTEIVLLVDDEDMIIDVGEEILKELGYRVLLARSGKEAIEVYEKNKDNIDMVILDMIMPDTGGGEVYDRMKGINPNVKVLLSSGYSVEGQATEILERGCDGFIQKPFNIRQLSEKIRDVLDSK
ncbi:MAG: PAS domain S-box protein [Deltaproteobacteria bacterium]|nr:PAS domain S-box protein [Deltaproteobacteria bacterium]MBW2019699.1 PAS domain S-box protein [Deltaproteobacteria bacterium]MBW2074534.1 PAS domain S-box protein [Deltaproteobacteria bacterium]